MLNKEFSTEESQIAKRNLKKCSKLYIVLTEDPAIPLLDIYPEDSTTFNKDTCSTIFIASLFIIARS